MANPTLDQLRHFAIARSLFEPTNLLRAINKLGFVPADPIRAQDLTLRSASRTTGPAIVNERTHDWGWKRIVRPREVEAHFAHGSVVNSWGTLRCAKVGSTVSSDTSEHGRPRRRVVRTVTRR